MFEALKQLVADGHQRTLSDMADELRQLTGKVPTRSTLHTYITKLRHQGYEFMVQRFGRRGGEAIYTLRGARDRERNVQ